MLKRFLKDKSGATALVFAVAMPVFVGGITLAVELGHWHQKKSKLQDMADNSAVAAAQEIMLLGDGAKFDLAGRGHAFENGFNFRKGNMQIVSPPTEGKYAGKNAVEVTMIRDQEMYFAQVFGGKSFEQVTKATAIVLDGVPACFLSLSPDMGPAISSGGSTSITLNGCGVHANSTDPQAIMVKDFKAECISSTGGIVPSNETVLLDCTDYEPYSNTVRDPYADVHVPLNLPPCDTSGGNRVNRNLMELYPGRYCSRDVYFGGTVHFTQPGVYYFDGVNLGTSGGSALIYGRGVTLVFFNGGKFFPSNSGTIDLTAPNTSQVSGDEAQFAAMSIYFDADTSPHGDYISINGNAASQVEGVIYAPTINIKMAGTGNAGSTCTQVVAHSVDFNGNAEFTNDNCESLGARQIGGLSGIALVE